MALTDIVSHTPVWVFALLAALLWLGLRQTVPHRMHLVRVVGVALVMTALSLWGIATLAHTAAGHVVWLFWLAAWGLCVVALRHRVVSAHAQYDPVDQAFALPGARWPLGVMLGIFGIKYLIGAGLAMQASWLQSAPLVLALAALLGACSGVFMARALGLLRLARAVPLAVN